MIMDMRKAIRAVVEGRDLSIDEMTEVMTHIMTGEATAAQIAGCLVGLRMKGETVDGICGAAQVMRRLASSVEVEVPHLVDTCGTGGDGAHTFNISTASAFVAAAAGAHVAKHGNRSVSSQSGSADVLEAAGVRLDLSATQVASCIRDVGIGFMFAPMHHGAMKHAIGPRREMGVRTVFNLLGPLTNPAAAPNQVIGVFSAHWLEPLARVLDRLGSRHVLIVHAGDGMDEISIGAPTEVVELRAGEIRRYTLEPESFGIQPAGSENLIANDAKESLQFIHAAFDNRPGPARDIVALNAAAAIYCAGLADDLAAGFSTACSVIEQGLAREKLAALVRYTNAPAVTETDAEQP